MPSPELINQSVPLPEEKIGWVIGKNGSYVQQLAVKSGATLRVSDSSSYEYGRTWKYVQISGPPRAVDRAKKLLHIRLERLADRPTDSAAAQQIDATDYAAPSTNGYAATIGAAAPAARAIPVPAPISGSINPPPSVEPQAQAVEA